MSCWSYGRCSGCDHEHRQVYPSGPLDADIVIIGEGPGAQEDREGVPFVGRSGQELDQTYLRVAGLDRRDVFVSNGVQCRCERNGVDVRPADGLLHTCAANHLWEELALVQPKVILLCGAAACSLAGNIDLTLEHGRPRQVENCAGLGGWSGWLWPMYHPAAGMHETATMTPLLEDFEHLGMWIRGRWQPPLGSSRPTQYKLITRQSELTQAFHAWDGWTKEQTSLPYMPIDTESDEGKPWSVQFSPRPGLSYMILAENKSLIEDFDACLVFGADARVILHNAAYDLDELDHMGIYVREFRDTMQELYHLGNLPQGLKAAVYRVFGYRMTSYDEVVTPHSKSVLESWLAEALALTSSDLRTQIPHPIGPDCPTCGKRHRKDVSVAKPHEAEAVLRRVMNKLSEPGSEYDAWQQPKWERGPDGASIEKCRLLGRGWLPEIEAAIGRMPRKSIVHAPLERAVEYGCGDADWTGRLAAWLDCERKRIVGAEWRVV